MSEASRLASTLLWCSFPDDHAHRPDRCSQAFPGPRPFSAREAQAVRAYVDRLDRRVQLAVHLQPSYEAKKVGLIGGEEFVGEEITYLPSTWLWSSEGVARKGRGVVRLFLQK